jgi:hypothetical protein
VDEITNYTSVIDSRDIIERIAELEAIEGALDLDDHQELLSLADLNAQGKTLPDWEYGVTLIHDAYWVDYAEQYAEDTCPSPGARVLSEQWPFTHIDWDRAAADLQVDYTQLEFDGQIYWAR